MARRNAWAMVALSSRINGSTSMIFINSPTGRFMNTSRPNGRLIAALKFFRDSTPNTRSWDRMTQPGTVGSARKYCSTSEVRV